MSNFEQVELSDKCLDVTKIGLWTWNEAANTIVWDVRMKEIFGTFAGRFEDFEALLYHPSDSARIKIEIAKSSHIGDIYEFDYEIVTPQGEHKFIYARGKKISEVRHYGICMDVTTTKQMEMSLKRSNEELEKFAYAASHDLKAPLRAITNLVEWISDSVENPSPEVMEYQSLLAGRIVRMENLINGLLEYSRIGRMNAAKQNVSVQQLLEDLNSQITIASPNFKLIFSDLPSVYMNSVRVLQIFSNLIENSIKHHHKQSGTIEITAVPKGIRWLFCVSDDGPGIDERYHGKIFELFQTLVPKDTREATGIGLTLVRKIIQESGGEISIESAPGEGTKFYFTLPKAINEDK